MRVQGSRLAQAALVGAWLVAPGMLFAQSGASPPDSAKKPDPPPPPVNHLETTWAGSKLTGFAQGSYSDSGGGVGDTASARRLYDRWPHGLTVSARADVLGTP